MWSLVDFVKRSIAAGSMLMAPRLFWKRNATNLLPEVSTYNSMYSSTLSASLSFVVAIRLALLVSYTLPPMLRVNLGVVPFP